MDGRSDLYSLGCVLYEMLAGEVPHTGTSAQAIIGKRLHEPVPHIRSIRDAVPPAVDSALLRVLAKTPADRYPTADAFARALGPSIGHELDTPSAPVPTAIEPFGPSPTVKAVGIGHQHDWGGNGGHHRHPSLEIGAMDGHLEG